MYTFFACSVKRSKARVFLGKGSVTNWNLMYMQSLHAGDRSPVTHSILRLGIALLEEGNDHIQGEMLDQLKSMDVGFLASVAHLIAGCSVLDWNAYERHQKSEMMHSSKSLGL